MALFQKGDEKGWNISTYPKLEVDDLIYASAAGMSVAVRDFSCRRRSPK
jgi:hypothetical protein